MRLGIYGFGAAAAQAPAKSAGRNSVQSGPKRPCDHLSEDPREAHPGARPLAPGLSIAEATARAISSRDNAAANIPADTGATSVVPVRDTGAATVRDNVSEALNLSTQRRFLCDNIEYGSYTRCWRKEGHRGDHLCFDCRSAPRDVNFGIPQNRPRAFIVGLLRSAVSQETPSRRHRTFTCSASGSMTHLHLHLHLRVAA